MADRSELEGTLRTMSIAEVLQWAGAIKKTGAVEVQTPTGRKTVFFRDGQVIYATSAQKSEKIGSFLARSGKLNREKMEILRTLQRSTRKSFDGIALENGLLAGKDIREAVDALVEAVFQMLVVVGEGSFKFVEDKAPPKGAVPTSVSIEDLLTGGLKIRQEWNQISTDLPHQDARMALSEQMPAGVRKEMSRRERRLLDLLDGQRTIKQVRTESPLPEFVTCRFLARLAKDGLLVEKDAAAAEIRTLDGQITQITGSIDQGQLFESLAALNRILAQRPGYPLAVFQRDRARKLLDEQVRQSIKSMDLIPVRTEVDALAVEGLVLDSREGYLLSRVDDRTNLQGLARSCGVSDSQVQRIFFKLLSFGLVRLESKGKSHRPRSAPTRLKAPTPRPPPVERPKPEREFEAEPKPSAQIKYTLKELNQVYARYLKMNHYERLEVSRRATVDEIREAYTRLSKLYHPDMYYQDQDQLEPQAIERLEDLFSMVYTSYKELSSAVDRGRYDKELADKHDVEDMGQSVLYEDFLKAFSTATKRKRKEQKEKRRARKEQKEKDGEPVEEPPSEEETFEEEPPAPIEEVDITTAMSSPSRSRPRDRREIAKDHYEASQKLFEEKKFHEVIDQMSQAIRRDARQHEYYALLAQAQHEARRQLDQAVENTKKAIMLNKEHPPYYVLLSRIYRAMEDLPSAERYMKIAVAWDPSNREAFKELKELREEQNSSIFKRLFRKKKADD